MSGPSYALQKHPFWAGLSDRSEKYNDVSYFHPVILFSTTKRSA